MLFRSDRKSTRLNSSHLVISYAVFCLKKKKNNNRKTPGVTYTGETDPQTRGARATCARSQRPTLCAVGIVARSYVFFFFFFFNDAAPPDFSPLPLPAPLPI